MLKRNLTQSKYKDEILLIWQICVKVAIKLLTNEYITFEKILLLIVLSDEKCFVETSFLKIWRNNWRKSKQRLANDLTVFQAKHFNGNKLNFRKWRSSCQSTFLKEFKFFTKLTFWQVQNFVLCFIFVVIPRISTLSEEVERFNSNLSEFLQLLKPSNFL